MGKIPTAETPGRTGRLFLSTVEYMIFHCDEAC
jgi:hypothetical protein